MAIICRIPRRPIIISDIMQYKWNVTLPLYMWNVYSYETKYLAKITQTYYANDATPDEPNEVSISYDYFTTLPSSTNSETGDFGYSTTKYSWVEENPNWDGRDESEKYIDAMGPTIFKEIIGTDVIDTHTSYYRYSFPDAGADPIAVYDQYVKYAANNVQNSGVTEGTSYDYINGRDVTRTSPGIVSSSKEDAYAVDGLDTYQGEEYWFVRQ